jgi:exodeoxyribonuclease VII large subunit
VRASASTPRSSLVANTRAAQSKLDRVAARLRPEALLHDATRRRDLLARASARLVPAMTRTLEAHKKQLDAAARMLDSLSHKSVLARGFVMVHRDDGTLVRAAKDLSPGDEIELTFADDKQRAVIDPDRAPAADPARPKPKARPVGGQGDLF